MFSACGEEVRGGAEDRGACRAGGAGEVRHVLEEAEDLKGKRGVVSGRADGDGKSEVEPTGTSTLRNMAMPLMASLRAMSWGVETMMAPMSRPKYIISVSVTLEQLLRRY